MKITGAPELPRIVDRGIAQLESEVKGLVSYNIDYLDIKPASEAKDWFIPDVRGQDHGNLGDFLRLTGVQKLEPGLRTVDGLIEEDFGPKDAGKSEKSGIWQTEIRGVFNWLTGSQTMVKRASWPKA